MIIRYFVVFTLLATLFWAAGCENCRDQPGSEEYNELVEMFNQGNVEPKHRFLSYPVEKQIDIYLISVRCTNDPRIRPLLELGGVEKITAILNRIESDPEWMSKRVLVSSLIGINSTCKCVDEDALETLDRVSRTSETSGEDSVWKSSYMESVEFLREQVMTNP